MSPVVQELIESVHNRDLGGREMIRHLLWEPTNKLLVRFLDEYKIESDDNRLNILTERTLRTVEVYLRSRHPSEFLEVSEAALVNAMLVFIAKVTTAPFGRDTAQLSGIVYVPENAAFSTGFVYLPYEKIGEFLFGGDWIGGWCDDNGSLWVIIADVTGHGYSAYLVANGLPYVWEMCTRGENKLKSPVQILSTLHNELASCLPDGVFVEATIAKFEINGNVTIASAGGGRVFFRSHNRCETEYLTLSGPWLGLSASPNENEECQIKLAPNDELVLSSDGFFDQIVVFCDKQTELGATLQELSRNSTLEATVKEMLQNSLNHNRQIDDISVVTARRTIRSEGVHEND